jgi:hypothetical protein
MNATTIHACATPINRRAESRITSAVVNVEGSMLM